MCQYLAGAQHMGPLAGYASGWPAAGDVRR